MDIVIDTTSLNQFLSLPPDKIFWVFFTNFGWIVLAIVFLLGARNVWLYYIRGQWSKTHVSVLLAIDIPKGNEQSPKAVENMFTYLAGAHGSQNFYEKWFEGIYQKSFSYEIVSLEGYTQFLIRTPLEFRNLVESSVYSQYPDAEISEVNDYTENVPQHWPDEEWDIFGTEFVLQNPWSLPIKTYEEFEHKMGPSETQFKDPMASLMDLCGSLRQGEQLWFQILVFPTGFDWVAKIQKELDKILGRKKKPKKDLVSMGLGVLDDVSEFIIPLRSDDFSKKNNDKDDKRTMLDLTPNEKRKVEAMHLKSIKLGLNVKLRMIYLAKKEVMNKAKVVNGFVGYIKQFMSLDLNSFKPDLKITMTKTVYFRKESRLNVKKNNIFRNYVRRSDAGRAPFLLNIEELATIWHFPVEANVKSPLIQKTPGRKADAPSSLPIEDSEVRVPDNIFRKINNEEILNTPASNQHNDFGEKQSSTPSNLPFIE